MPYWYWNGRITAADTGREIRAMLSQGVHQCIVFPWDGMEQRYLSPEYWRQVGEALRIARQLQFTLNFADEYDWPSGHAWTPPFENPELSKVLREHPEFRMHRLAASEESIEGPRLWRRGAGAAFVVAGRETPAGELFPDSLAIVNAVEWQVPAGHWLITTYRLEPTVAAHGTRLDLMNRAAVRAYLDLVYEPFYRQFGSYFGNTLKLTVADHEGSYGNPIAYTPELFKTFEGRHHYDLKSRLPMLTHDTPDAGTARRLRSDYLDTVSELYADAFSRQVADWCTAHHLMHGTSIYEEQLYIQVAEAGDMFRHWRAGSLVEIDALLERARMPVDFKEAVSVAHFDHKPLIVENQGLQGNSTFFSLEKARLGSNMALLWGANALVPYFDYDQKKVTWPPQWFLGQPFWRYFHLYADHVRRVQFMNAQGSHVAPILIYYPLETAFADSRTLFLQTPHRELFWNNAMDQTENFFWALQLELAKRHWDYHIVDREYLDRAAIRDHELHLGDEAFRIVIVPPMTDMDPRSEEKLKQFSQAGGLVLRLGQDIPVREHKPFMDHLDYTAQVQVPADIREDLQPLFARLRKEVPTQVELIGDGDHILFSHRRMPGTDWYWFVNDSAQSRAVRARFPASGAFEKWDAGTGSKAPLAQSDGSVELAFDPWDAYFVVRRDSGALAVPPVQTELSEIARLPNTGWKLTLETPCVSVPYAQDAAGNPVWLSPEALSNRKWWLIGPFPYEDHRGFFHSYGPEQTFDPEAHYSGAFGEVSWKWAESQDYIVSWRGRQSMGIYYAFANVYSPSEREGQIFTAFADSLAAWWNGQKLLNIHRHPKWSLLRDPWAERAPIHLKKGWNQVLLKIGPSLMVQTAFTFRIVDRQGTTMRDLVYARDQRLPAEALSDLRLTIATPPGTTGMTLAPGDRPEHAVCLATRLGSPFTLQSWTDSALANYSGTALYETGFELPAVAKKVLVDLGAVGVAAEVWVNGQHVGERGWEPFRFDITRAVRPGRNELRVRVANSDAGWQSQGDTVYPKGSWGLHYQTERDRIPTIRPNGLEGPVRILAAN